MKEIRFTLGNSPLWHSLYWDCQLNGNEVYDDLTFAYLITQELRKMGIQEPAKRFKVFDENKNEIAHSDDLSETAKLKYTNHETENS